MAQTPVPQPRELLPPLLACLPTAFVSPRPPPALLPLLSPILRQRLQYSGEGSATDGWLSLLSWDPQRAAKLASKVEVLQLEPHPVSGEIEIEDVFGIQYRRLDAETLQTRLELDQFDLLPVYVWCESDAHGGTGPGWKLAELRALEDTEDGTEWHSTAKEADEASSHYNPSQRQTNGTAHTSLPSVNQPQNDEDEDDDYWASYDRTPARTPAKHSPAPPSSHVFSQDRQANSYTPTSTNQEEDDPYYARYGSVQPALDSHDPDEADNTSAFQSTLSGNTFLPSHQPSQPRPDPHQPQQRSLFPSDPPKQIDSGTATRQSDSLPSPRPISPASSERSTKSLEKMEKQAVIAEDMTRAETGVKAFISSEVRNLFRLARSVGIERSEFEETVRRELEVVGMLEDA